MNRSDDRAIAALMTRDVVVGDEVAPYRRTGVYRDSNEKRSINLNGRNIDSRRAGAV
jgi:hypothetical protein